MYRQSSWLSRLERLLHFSHSAALKDRTAQIFVCEVENKSCIFLEDWWHLLYHAMPGNICKHCIKLPYYRQRLGFRALKPVLRLEISLFLMRYLRTTHTPKSMVWVCESAHVFTLNMSQLRGMMEMHSLLKVSFQPGTHKCQLTRKQKFLPLPFMWLMPQTRPSSWPHTDIKAFKQGLG